MSTTIIFKKRNRSNKQNIRNKDDEEDLNNNDNNNNDQEEETNIIKPQLRTISQNIQTTKQLSDELTTTTSTVYTSNREVVPQKYAGDATHTSEIDTATDRDARAILERNIKLNKEGIVNDQDKIYRGQAGYKNYITKDISQIGSNKYTGTQGPVRAPTFMRATAVFDYKPDICKDYKETGFCGYGDNCKFLHDRGDYKSGWQLEKEWEEAQARKKKKLEDSVKGFMNTNNNNDDEDDDEDNDGETKTSINLGKAPVNPDDGDEDDIYAIDLSDEENNAGLAPSIGKVDSDGLPFACFLCRDRFVDPVVTLCHHYFCRKCIENESRNNKSICPVCQKQTHGVFNKADKLIRKIKKMKGNGNGI